MVGLLGELIGLRCEDVMGVSTHSYIMWSNFSENRAVYEIMWGNMLKPDRPQMTL